MQSVVPPGDPTRTVIAGKSQGWLGLAVNYGQTTDANMGGPYPTMVTAWEPSAQELAALNAGANVVVQLLGTPPINPMNVHVSDPPPDAPIRKPNYDADIVTLCVKVMRSRARTTAQKGVMRDIGIVTAILEAAGLEASGS